MHAHVELNERRWKSDLKSLTEEIADHADSPDANHALAVVQARAALGTMAMARWTKWLAIATFVLAAATVVLVVVAIAAGD
jgi:hypothetical protein